MADFSTITARLTWPHEIIGPCLLINADCLAVLPLLEAGSVDAVVTDPPYGIGFAAQPTKWQRRAGQQPEAWDNEPADVRGLLPLAGCVVIWGGNYYSLPPTRGWLSWFKPDAPPSMASLELAWTSRDMNARQIQHSISATNGERIGHPTQKPIRVMQWCMEQVGVPVGATVIDPFMGSATTGVACIRTGRRFIGIELDEGYYRIACDRIRREWEQWQGGPMFAPKAKASALF
jgi:site-specific DNA-methyltransferase (adenine-specific)/modification methylase